MYDASYLTKKSNTNKTPSRDKPAIKLDDIKQSNINDLEKIALRKEPILQKIKKALADIGISNSVISGSGPSIFSLFEKRKEAERARDLLVRELPLVRDKGWQVFVVSTL